MSLEHSNAVTCLHLSLLCRPLLHSTVDWLSAGNLGDVLQCTDHVAGLYSFGNWHHLPGNGNACFKIPMQRHRNHMLCAPSILHACL